MDETDFDEVDFDLPVDDFNPTGDDEDTSIDPDDEHALNGYYADSVPAYMHCNTDEED